MMDRDYEQLRFILQDEKYKIIRFLENGPSYTGEIADKLGYSWQKTYYHIRTLKKKGIIEVIDEKNIKGATAKVYALKPQVFRVSIASGFGRHIKSLPQQLFANFWKGGHFDGIICVGSPDPHGPLGAQARDGWLATNIGWYLGRFFDIPKTPILTDVELRKRKEETNNLILIGGPVSNLITREINDKLLIRFDGDPWGLRNLNGEIYTDTSIGLVASTPNPKDVTKSILVLAGISLRGTQAAILSIIKEKIPIPSDFTQFATIVKGIDSEGIGDISDIEIIFTSS